AAVQLVVLVDEAGDRRVHVLRLFSGLGEALAGQDRVDRRVRDPLEHDHLDRVAGDALVGRAAIVVARPLADARRVDVQQVELRTAGAGRLVHRRVDRSGRTGLAAATSGRAAA